MLWLDGGKYFDPNMQIICVCFLFLKLESYRGWLRELSPGGGDIFNSTRAPDAEVYFPV